ncbi:hypothetical protein KVR01_002242 [Diaporthe batatas]|uniref:tRNA-specific adenosine deaminase n=1 Tax=Diaporthe batatas TaxID=748121 RepID=UPI001D055EB1|nr:tRNA-specific adenosine deaminase [Diaporthe batatas]KAG8166553.1 hypothetical protein KVR01_002242 [Diaporthe batatas]
MTTEADEVASLVLEQFERLPAKRKPSSRDNGTREWVPLAGIVARHGDGSLQCLALATGMKCLPASKLSSAKGRVLHDWHAEVLVIRAFNYFILQECRAIATDGKDSPYVCRRTSTTTDEPSENRPQFFWKEDVTLHMYCSEAPCGDASMELTMSAQQDASPWEAPLPPHLMPKEKAKESALLGRACFGQLGVVRRKPARADAPPSLSKSCSDKLAMRQCVSLLSSPAALLISPAGVYLTSLVLPESQFSAVAFERCFSTRGRLAALGTVGTEWEGGYAFRPFEVQTTGLEFEHSRRGSRCSEGVRYVASNLATAWTRNGLEENLIGGVLQGRRQSDMRAGSAVSRGRMWLLVQEILQHAESAVILPTFETYESHKKSPWLTMRSKVKEDVRREALKGWIRNTGDDVFG